MLVNNFCLFVYFYINFKITLYFWTGNKKITACSYCIYTQCSILTKVKTSPNTHNKNMYTLFFGALIQSIKLHDQMTHTHQIEWMHIKSIHQTGIKFGCQNLS